MQYLSSDYPHVAAPLPVAKYNDAMEWSFRTVETCEYVTNTIDGELMVIFSFVRADQRAAFEAAFS